MMSDVRSLNIFVILSLVSSSYAYHAIPIQAYFSLPGRPLSGQQVWTCCICCCRILKSDVIFFLDETKYHLKSILFWRASLSPRMKAADADNLERKFKTNQVVQVRSTYFVEKLLFRFSLALSFEFLGWCGLGNLSQRRGIDVDWSIFWSWDTDWLGFPGQLCEQEASSGLYPSIWPNFARVYQPPAWVRHSSIDTKDFLEGRGELYSHDFPSGFQHAEYLLLLGSLQGYVQARSHRKRRRVPYLRAHSHRTVPWGILQSAMWNIAGMVQINEYHWPLGITTARLSLEWFEPRRLQLWQEVYLLLNILSLRL